MNFGLIEDDKRTSIDCPALRETDSVCFVIQVAQFTGKLSAGAESKNWQACAISSVFSNLSMHEAEAGGFLWAWGQPGLFMNLS